jgi:hypothetical protein
MLLSRQHTAIKQRGTTRAWAQPRWTDQQAVLLVGQPSHPASLSEILKLSDLWPLDASTWAAVLVARFERAWAVQLLKPAGKRSLSAALGYMFWPTLIVTGMH